MTEQFPILAAGVAAAGVGVLYGLHHLRVEPARRAAATLLFWRQTVRPQQAKVLGSRRFTHRKTFLLLAAIVLLLAATLTSERWGRNDRRDVIVIDTGAATGAVDAAGHTPSGHTLLGDLAAAARADLRQLGRAALISAGPQPVLLAGADTPAALTARRLDALTPQPGASEAAGALLMAGEVIGDDVGSIHWYTDRTQLPAGLPEAIARRVVLHATAAPDAAVIAGVTFEPSAGDGSRGTLRVRLAGSRPFAGMTLRVEADGWPPLERAAAMAGREADVAFDDQPADGRVVRLRLDHAPGAAATHVAEYRLPDRRPLTFRLAADVPPALRAALATAGVEADDGVVYVGPATNTVPAGMKAAILVVSGDAGVKAGSPLRLGDASIVHGLDLEGATAGEGPAVGTGVPLLTAGGVPVASLDNAGGLPTLRLSLSVVGPGADLPRRAAFPVLLGRLCDVLGGRGGPVAAVAVSRSAEDPLWAGPADAPELTSAAVADRPAVAGVAIAPTVVAAAGPSWRWTEILFALALLGLAVDASLRAARKIV